MNETLEEALRKYAFFEDLEEDELRRVAGLSRRVYFPSGQLVFKAGGVADTLLLIRKGTLALELEEPSGAVVEVEALGPGDLADLAALLPPHRWRTDARAACGVAAIAFDAARLREVIGSDPILTARMTKKALTDLQDRLERAWHRR